MWSLTVFGDARTWIVIAFAITTIAADCDPDCTQPERIQSGTYETVGSGDRRGAAAQTSPTFVHEGIPGKRLVVEKAGGTVRIEYEKDGHHIVENWRVTKTGKTGQ